MRNIGSSVRRCTLAWHLTSCAIQVSHTAAPATGLSSCCSKHECKLEENTETCCGGYAERVCKQRAWARLAVLPNNTVRPRYSSLGVNLSTVPGSDWIRLLQSPIHIVPANGLPQGGTIWRSDCIDKRVASRHVPFLHFLISDPDERGLRRRCLLPNHFGIN
jgi:hypothetical protein